MRRGQDSDGGFQTGQDPYSDVSPECPTTGHSGEKGSGVSSGFAGDTARALHRTRTGDPFLTMPNHDRGWKWKIRCYYSVLCLIGGLLLLYVFGGSRVL